MGVAQTVAWELGVLPHIVHAAQTAAWKLGAGWWWRGGVHYPLPLTRTAFY